MPREVLTQKQVDTIRSEYIAHVQLRVEQGFVNARRNYLNDLAKTYSVNRHTLTTLLKKGYGK